VKPLSSHSIAELAALGTIPVLGVFLMWALWPVHRAIKTNSAGSAAVLAKAGTALDTINAPPHDDGHQIVYGTLSGIDQTTKNVGILAALVAEQVKQSGVLIKATTRNLDAMGTAVTGTMGHLNTASDDIAGVARTANGSIATLSTHTQTAIDTANSTMGTLDTSIATQNAALSKSQADFQAVLDGALPIEARATSIAGHWDGISGDFQTRFHLVLFPPPCKTFGCKLARAYPYIKDAAALGESAYWTRALFENIKP
jgi:hypothetical protein